VSRLTAGWRDTLLVTRIYSGWRTARFQAFSFHLRHSYQRGVRESEQLDVLLGRTRGKLAAAGFRDGSNVWGLNVPFSGACFVKVRFAYSFPTDMRAELEQIVSQCAAENGGRVLGDPTISYDGKSTSLQVDEVPWWTELMRLRHMQLVLIGANRIMIGDSPAHLDPPPD